MHLFLLGGNSLRNREWIYEVEKALAPLFSSVSVQEYLHWQNGTSLIDIETESARLNESARSVGPYAVFAKSAGALTTLKSVAEGGLAPRACIFAGTAIGLARELKLSPESWLANYNVPTLFIHNTHDPLIDAAALQELVERSGAQHYQFKIIDSDTHDDPDLELLQTEVGRFLSTLPA